MSLQELGSLQIKNVKVKSATLVCLFWFLALYDIIRCAFYVIYIYTAIHFYSHAFSLSLFLNFPSCYEKND